MKIYSLHLYDFYNFCTEHIIENHAVVGSLSAAFRIKRSLIQNCKPGLSFIEKINGFPVFYDGAYYALVHNIVISGKNRPALCKMIKRNFMPARILGSSILVAGFFLLLHKDIKAFLIYFISFFHTYFFCYIVRESVSVMQLECYISGQYLLFSRHLFWVFESEEPFNYAEALHKGVAEFFFFYSYYFAYEKSLSFHLRISSA